ncbi:hypothetical protein Taro_008919 [Colocasia esculenta]|uniref:RanBP2-type domain-containing protein n=1 Tax=Colocasia esculenta TaxID=4460 RepID=A0A843TV31_COLES|nr:hypothetical protein [Colocasia esculenta]
MALRGVWQKLVVSYCDWGGSSRGIRCMSLGFGQHVRCLGSRANKIMNVHESDGKMRNERWTCPKCQSINSVHHQRCMGCLEPDSVSISRLRTFGFSLGADSHNARRVALPQSIIKYCVLRSPHIDKKSREQFEMRIKKLYMVVKTRSEDLQKKFFWLKRQRILGAQYEIVWLLALKGELSRRARVQLPNDMKNSVPCNVFMFITFWRSCPSSCGGFVCTSSVV